MAISRGTIESLLHELGEWLEYDEVGPLDLLVCGGSAMALLQLNDRTTRDVDVLGLWDSNLIEVTCVDEFPENVTECIRRVAQDHPDLQGMGEHWVNLGPRDLARQGLPDGYKNRLKAMPFGRRGLLTLHLLDRKDLIALKLYAAADRFSTRQEIHLDDLRRLKGTFEELDDALNWVRTLRDFEEKRPEIQNALERLGFDDLAGYI